MCSYRFVASPDAAVERSSVLDELTSSVSGSAVQPRRTTVFVLGLAIIVVIVVCALATSADKPRVSVAPSASLDPIPGGLTEKDLLAIVDRSAAASGELHPTNVQWLATTRGVAFDLMGEPQGPGSTDLAHAVIYLQASGKFTVSILRGPRPAAPLGSPTPAPPHGSCLQMAIDRTTGEELDGGFSGTCADLSRLSGVHTVG